MTPQEEADHYRYLQLKAKILSSQPEESQPPQAVAAPPSLASTVGTAAEKLLSPLAALHPKNMTGLLPMAGTMAGTALEGGVPGPLSAAGAGAGSIAQSMADMVYGKKPLVQPTTSVGGIPMAPKEAIWPMANTALQGIPLTQEGQAAGQAISNKVGPVLKWAKDSFKESFPGVAQAMTGKSAVKVKGIMKDPTAILPESLGGAKSVEDASDAYGKALAEDKTPIFHKEGYVTKGIKPVKFSPFSRGTSEANDVAQGTWDRWQAGDEINAQEAFAAKKATDKIWPAVVKERNKETIRDLSEFKTAMDDILSSQGEGPFQQASKDYGRAILGRDFTQLLPRTKTGDISTVKTLLLHSLHPGRSLGMLAAGVTSPAVTGAGNLAVQGGMKGLNAIASNPQARQALLQALQQLVQSSQSQRAQ